MPVKIIRVEQSRYKLLQSWSLFILDNEKK